MKYIAQKRPACVLLLMVLLFLLPLSTFGVVLHPDGEPNLLTWTDRPDENVVGRWGSNATCVVVSSDCVLTVRHAGGSTSTLVEIGGQTYGIDEIWNHSTADLRIAKLSGANLANFVDIYELTNERFKQIVMAGYGDGRGGLLQKDDITYGYQWDNSSNTIRRFCTNKINSTQNNSTVSGYTSNIIIADFDGLGEGNSTAYEGSLGDHDSGGGWFINDSGIWKVAGLSRAVEHFEQSWFRDSNDPNILDPDSFDAVRVSSYATWIYTTIPTRLPGELTGDGWVDFADFAVFASYWLDTGCHYPDWCRGCDFEPDGDVDLDDLTIFTYYWLADEPPS